SAWGTNSQWVFWTLCVAAFLTAFYTMRQIGLSFLGQPRTQMAEHAPESVPQMTIPLLLIAPFAIALGWFGLPTWLGPSFIDHILEPYIEYQGFHGLNLGCSIVPLGMSLVVALGGLAAGWLVYGRGLAEGQIDPLRNWLGPLWVVFHNKYWIDEFYNSTVVAFVPFLAKLLYWFDDVWV